MQKKSEDFSIEDAMRLAKSPAAQQLFNLLQRQDSAQLHKAMDDAAAGDYQQAGQTLQELLNSAEAKALMQQLRR